MTSGHRSHKVRRAGHEFTLRSFAFLAINIIIKHICLPFISEPGGAAAFRARQYQARADIAPESSRPSRTPSIAKLADQAKHTAWPVQPL